MADQLKLYLFGDQALDIQPYLKDLIQYKYNPILEDFLVKAYDAIRTEIYNLPREIRDDLPRFTCINDIIFRKQGGRRCVPLDMAVTCMYQLGVFISQFDPQNCYGDRALILGLGTGVLAAAAVSCSRSTLELIPMALDAVIVAFRTGLQVTDVAHRLLPSSVSDRSWSIIVLGLASAEAAVKRFCEQTMLPLTSKPYISAYMPKGLTVSGPPCSLAKLTGFGSFKNLEYQSTQIYGPYHAPHLYSQDDVDKIVGSLIPHSADVTPKRIPLFSSTGASVEGGNFKSVLKAAVGQILLRPIRWSGILEELQIYLQKSGFKTFSINPIGTKADQLIYEALKQTPLRELLLSAPAQSEPSLSGDASHSSHGKSKLAIIGMSGRFPGAKDNEAFWDLLYQGLDVHKPVPALHWDVKTHVDLTGARRNTSATPFGCWLDDPAVFDARFFNISPREAPQIDPAQRLALMTAYEAIEQAGIVPDATPSTRRDRVGVFYGVTSNDWMETNSAQDIDTYFIPGGNRAFIPGRINYCFKFSGPSFAVDTACSSSLAGIHLACNSLWRGDIDTAIAGGTNVLTNPDFTSGLDRGHFLSRTGNCKTFDDSADGYCRGEGIGSVIIKRLDDVIADKDPILGVILSAYTNHSAESDSITRPHVGAQREIFSKILNEAAVDPYNVSYVEMHGTGTQAGDASEMSSVLDTFAPPLDQIKTGRSSHETLYLGSAKANIGHGEAASGVSSLMKVLLMMQKNVIVPHCGIKTKINHRFPTDLEERNVRIALKPTPWERNSDPARPRRVFVNNFSAAGGNSAVLLEDAPLKRESPSEAADPRSHHLVAVSAKSGVSLQGNLRAMLGYLKQSPVVSLGRLSYTTTARRLHHQHRVMCTGSTIEEICTQIEAALCDQTGMTIPKNAPKIVFTFTGQGAQYPGMGKELFENFSIFRTEILGLEKIGQSLGFPSILPVIQSEEYDIGIFAPIAVQLASVCIQIALSKLWASWNIAPTAVVGHSLGEYAALNVAGVLSDADTVYLVGMRAELLQKNCTRDTHAMLVIKGSVDEIAGVTKNKTYEIACINSPIETVVAGPNEVISGLKRLLTDAGIKSTLLKVPYAFHSSQMDPVLADFKKLASGVTFFKAKFPILCPLDGNIIDGIGSFNPEYLARHSREPVNMLKALLVARSDRVITDQTKMLEIGSHSAMSGMIGAILGPQTTCLASSQRGRPAFQVLTSTLKNLYVAGADIRWSKYHYDFKISHEVIQLPAYSWDLKKYWMQYVNDWSLRKGDPPLTISNASTIESTTIHRVVEETGDYRKTHIVVETDIARKDLSSLVQGHEVDGTPLCTPSVYADIALSLGTYLLKRYRPDQKENLVDVSDMIISKALILRAGAIQQLLQAYAEVDWSSNAAAIKFVSFDSHQKLQEHSRCILRFKNRCLLQKLQKDAALVKQKMQALRDGITTGVTARFNRPMVYRAIRPLARFHDDYRAIDEIVLNSNTLEASSHLSFCDLKRGGTYHTHPAIIDSLTQSCGFAMNCNDGTDLDFEVFMNHGWGSLQIFEPLNFEKKYTTYTRMTEGADKLWHGDVVVFDGEEIVVYFGQIAIQGVQRRVLKVILSLESGNMSRQQSVQKKQPAPTAPAPSTDATQVSAPMKGESHASKLAQALSIIAEESGLALSDLTDNTVFGDVGIDSLLGLTVSARFQEELDVCFDSNALFFDCPTVGDLKAFLGESEARATVFTPPPTNEISLTPKADFQRALQIISEESGVAMEDLIDDTDFANSGVDSLLSLVIVSRLRDELELDIRHEFLFMDCPTVGDLKHFLSSNKYAKGTAQPLAKSKSVPTPGPETAEDSVKKESTSLRTDSDNSTLALRKKAVDDYIQKYTVGLSAPVFSSSSTVLNDNTKVVLVTGASGGLGCHLVDQIAQTPDVKTVICLNREKSMGPYVRQQKAMREKGIRSFDKIRPKLLVLQTDSSKLMLGLSSSEYEGLVNSVTHLIHNAWPMSAKRPLAGFESQFQVMRNLIDFACEIGSRRPECFKFNFQLVSSIGVVGHYGLRNGEKKTTVPEARVGVDSVLPNGYGDAKWGCERMLDKTLHKYPNRFRTMVVRLGQIAGSNTSGYWNPMEHFGFLIKSSQTLNALPDVDGTVYWTPVNDVAGALSDLVLSDRTPYPIYHIENPIGQPWRTMNAILADALNITNLVPFEEWVTLVRGAPQRNNPAATLLDFLDNNYLRMSCGGLVLDVKNTLEHSRTLSAVGPVSEEVIRKYIHVWKEIGFLN
uniref:Non-reducing polyketide synthase n=1 Tax=Nephromopsis pallescens TaxID=150890 RepID=A0A678PM42_9LECA|nr:non-reducing polyketide synthase [Nephromopsis pallescens]